MSADKEQHHMPTAEPTFPRKSLLSLLGFVVAFAISIYLARPSYFTRASPDQAFITDLSFSELIARNRTTNRISGNSTWNI